MKEVFDAQEIAIYPRPDGTVGHAALRIGGSMIELADVSAEWPAMPCALQVYVPDTDAAPKRDCEQRRGRQTDCRHGPIQEITGTGGV